MRTTHRIMSAFAGAASGFVVMALVDPAQRSTHLDIWAIAAGAVLATLIHELVARRD